MLVLKEGFFDPDIRHAHFAVASDLFVAVWHLICVLREIQAEW